MCYKELSDSFVLNLNVSYIEEGGVNWNKRVS